MGSAAAQNQRLLQTSLTRASSVRRRKGARTLLGWTTTTGWVIIGLVAMIVLGALALLLISLPAVDRRQQPQQPPAQKLKANAARTDAGIQKPEERTAAKIASEPKPEVHLRREPEKVAQPAVAVAAAPTTAAHDNQDREVLLIKTQLGEIHVVLRRDLSAESVDYLQAMAHQKACSNCRFYRAEQNGILQGVVASPQQVPLVSVKGRCPAGYESVKNDCPEWDPECGCHGPVMTQGMVAWAAGQTGPDFFIDNYKKPANWWGTQHTVFGQILDPKSLAVVEQLLARPVKNQGGLSIMVNPVKFELGWTTEASAGVENK